MKKAHFYNWETIRINWTSGHRLDTYRILSQLAKPRLIQIINQALIAHESSKRVDLTRCDTSLQLCQTCSTDLTDLKDILQSFLNYTEN